MNAILILIDLFQVAYFRNIFIFAFTYGLMNLVQLKAAKYKLHGIGDIWRIRIPGSYGCIVLLRLIALKDHTNAFNL